MRIQQRAGDAGLIVRGAARTAGTGVTGLAGHAAAAGVHGRDELEARGIGDAVVGAGDHAFPAFDGLAERIEDGRREFGEFVEEEHAAMGERDLARPGALAAADHRGHRGGMMGRAERAAVGEAPVGQFARDGGDARDVEDFSGYQGWQDGGQTTREHRLAGAGRPAHQYDADAGF